MAAWLGVGEWLGFDDNEGRAQDGSDAAIGIFLASDERGPKHLAKFEGWLRRKVTVGRTYLPGERWESIEGASFVLDPWLRWKAATPGRILALNVPMVAPNEAGMPDHAVAGELQAGANGARDHHFGQLARKLVSSGAGDTIIVLGWEMNGTTYSSRCAPNPQAWKDYWRRIVTTMRATPGQQFRFDFAPSRGRDAIPWTECYPGDDVVDIIGMDSYDQWPGRDFSDYVNQPYGLEAQAKFAEERGKPISFPEWGLFRYGDRPQFVEKMLDWIERHDVAYHSITDYCPHGVWLCSSNPRSAEVFRKRLRPVPSTAPSAVPAPSPSLHPVVVPSTCPASESIASSTSNPAASDAAAAPSAAASSGCPSLSSSASASPASSPGATTAPTPPDTSSLSPGTSEATSDLPEASASSAVSGSPSQREGSTTTSDAAYQELTSEEAPAN